MKKILLYFSFSIIALNLLADPVDPTTAAKVATNFYRQQVMANSQMSKTKAQIILQDVTAQTPYQHMYVFNAADGNGFVLVAGDDRSIPILGYSDEGSFVFDSLPNNARSWILHYEQEIAYIVEHDAEPYETTADEWKTLRKGGTLATKGGSVDPLVKTQWSQSPYYNNLCPYNSSVNKRTVTGCVATAMAQVMKFWNHPAQGRSYHSYNCDYYGTQSANFANTTYDWSNMPSKLTSSSSSTQVNAVATLMYHCGVSIDMNYGYDGSSASTQNVPTALISYFKYDNGARYVQKNSYSESGWTTLIQTELNAGRPVVYRGQGEGGHAFVCDGYNSSNQFHFNWGWGGYCDGYYSTSNLAPGTGGTGAGNGTYTVNQGAVIGIKPASSSSTSTPNLKMYSTLTVNDTRFGSNVTGTIQVSNKGTNTFTGKLGVIIFNEEDIAVTSQVFNVSSLQQNYHTNGSINITGGVPLIPGTYRAYALYSLDGNSWEMVPNGTNASASTTFKITYSALIETNSAFSKSTLIKGQEATVNVDVLNSGSSTFYGKVRISLASIKDGSHVQNIQILNVSNGLQANYHYTNGLNFTGTITAETGTYLMSLAYQKEGESNWYYAGSSKYQNPVFVTVVASPTLSVSPTSLSFQATGGNQAVTITGNVDWTASSSASWLTISPKSGTESGTLTATAAINNTNSSRSATITISGGSGVGSKTITVTQAAGSAIQPDAYEANNSASAAYNLGTVQSSSRTFTINANLHVSTDVDYYKINLPSGYNYTVSALMYDRYNSSSFSAFGALAFSQNGTNTTGTYDNEMPATTISNGGTIYFRIKGFKGNDNDLGTYQLIINVSRSSNTGIEEFEAEEMTLYPNPAIDKIYLTINKDVVVKEIDLVNAMGQLLRTYPGSQREFQVGDLPSGLYFMRVVTAEGVLTRKWRR